MSSIARYHDDARDIARRRSVRVPPFLELHRGEQRRRLRPASFAVRRRGRLAGRRRFRSRTVVRRGRRIVVVLLRAPPLRVGGFGFGLRLLRRFGQPTPQRLRGRPHVSLVPLRVVRRDRQRARRHL
eukprot:13519-Pelagococcus_subviridis.AAC.4